MNIDDVLAFARGKGLFWQAAEIYGATAGAIREVAEGNSGSVFIYSSS